MSEESSRVAQNQEKWPALTPMMEKHHHRGSLGMRFRGFPTWAEGRLEREKLWMVVKLEGKGLSQRRGCADSSLTQEVKKVLASAETLNFIYKPPKRKMGDE
jgi:hypothetical protein